MRLMVLFDLPVTTKKQRRQATAFRNFLLKDGYQMLQFSVYVRICNGMDAVRKHQDRLRSHLPNDGAVRCMVITEKQFESIEILIGRPTPADEPFEVEQLTLL